jgi:hypothetical protein
MNEPSYEVAVRASFQTLWSLFRERVENPSALSENVRLVEMVWQSESRAIRTTQVDGVSLTEQIELHAGRRTWTLTLVSHPLFEGATTYWLGSAAASDGTLELGCRVQWVSKSNGRAVEGIEETIQQGVLLLKYEAEKREPDFVTVSDDREVMFESPDYVEFTGTSDSGDDGL